MLPEQGRAEPWSWTCQPWVVSDGQRTRLICPALLCELRSISPSSVQQTWVLKKTCHQVTPMGAESLSLAASGYLPWAGFPESPDFWPRTLEELWG